MPRLRNDRATVLTTSSSQPLRMVGRASNTVTLVPRSLSNEANSQPMAPPPITATDSGSSLRASTSSEVITNSPSMSKPGMVRGTEPEASTTSVPVISVVVPSLPLMRTRWSGSSVPLPLNTWTPRPFRRPDRPLNSWSTTSCLRVWLTEKSTVGGAAVSGSALIPKRAESLTVR